jgi:hypothetical protein
MISFKKFIENRTNRPQSEPSYGNFSNMNSQYIKEGTKIYRGVRLPVESRKMKIRDILIQGTEFKKNKGQSDPWSLEFPVAERFATGSAISSQGYLLGKENTVNIIVEAELDGPNRDQIDWKQWGKTILGHGVSKGSDVESYWNPHKIGQVGIEDSHIENEVPILHSAYPTLKLIAIYVKNPETKKWTKKTEPEILG